LKHHENRIVTIYQIGEQMGNAYLKSATAQVAANGFRKKGLYPWNRNIFNDYEFVEDATVKPAPAAALIL
jgi:hypothetical protein